MTLREAARRLQAVATEAREIAARIDGIDEARWAIAVDLRATAHRGAPRRRRRGAPVTRLRRAVAALLVDLALRLSPYAGYFDVDDATPADTEEWAGLLILHAEAIHGCEHTGDARRAIGMVGPRGEPA